eukprot:scaffold15041_cov113-Isochrysis_galbana.AAC.1
MGLCNCVLAPFSLAKPNCAILTSERSGHHFRTRSSHARTVCRSQPYGRIRQVSTPTKKASASDTPQTGVSAGGSPQADCHDRPPRFPGARLAKPDYRVAGAAEHHIAPSLELAQDGALAVVSAPRYRLPPHLRPRQRLHCRVKSCGRRFGAGDGTAGGRECRWGGRWGPRYR